MHERLLVGLLNHPWIFTALGQALLGLGSAMAVLGLRVGRLGRRVERIFGRHGLEGPDVMSALPWWMRMLTPETIGDWTVVAIILATGAYLIYLGKWARRQLRG
ncbi:hypothetical protein B0B52_09565 [Polaromonas sp. A23]|nr:hypothetical protein B0B52_09565 [Polaromonas sp. A23]